MISALFPNKKAVIEGAMPVSPIRRGTACEFEGISPINTLQAHRPKEALFITHDQYP